MEKYLISPDDCLIVLAFKTNSTIRDAAIQLGCDPGGLLRKVHRIGRDHGVLEKVKGHWQLTVKGIEIISWVEDSIQSQRRLLLSKTSIRISTTMWLSEQLIIPNLSHLRAELKGTSEFQILVPTQGLEKEIMMGGTDFVVACHAPNDPAIAHKKIFKEEYSLIVPRAWGKEIKNKTANDFIDFLAGRTYIRHDYLNPDVLLGRFPNRTNSREITVDHMIGVRAAVASGQGWSYVPSLLVRDALRLNQIIEVEKGIQADRFICLWWRRENRESKKMIEMMASWLKVLG